MTHKGLYTNISIDLFNMDRGVLYLAKGQEFILEALSAASRLESIMPDMSISVVTDQELDKESTPFDNIIFDDAEFQKQDKPHWLKKTPYNQTLYLDTDVWVESPVYELFELLQEFDIGLAKDPLEPNIFYKSSLNDKIPASFPELNSGVIIYERNTRTQELFDRWMSNFTPSDTHDQRPLRPAMYHSDARMSVFPSRYNFMYRQTNVVNGSVKLFHGPLVDRGMNRVEIERAVEMVNSTEQRRCLIPYKNDILVRPPLSIFDHTIETIKQDGIRGFIRGSLTYLIRRLQNQDRREIESRNTKWSSSE